MALPNLENMVQGVLGGVPRGHVGPLGPLELAALPQTLKKYEKSFAPIVAGRGAVW